MPETRQKHGLHAQRDGLFGAGKAFLRAGGGFVRAGAVFSDGEKVFSVVEMVLSDCDKPLYVTHKVISAVEKPLSGVEKGRSVPEKVLSVAEEVISATEDVTAGANKGRSLAAITGVNAPRRFRQHLAFSKAGQSGKAVIEISESASPGRSFGGKSRMPVLLNAKAGPARRPTGGAVTFDGASRELPA